MTHTLVLGVVAISAFALIAFAQLRNIWLAIGIAFGPVPGLVAASHVSQPFVLRDQILIVAICLISSELVAALHVERLAVRLEARPSNDNIAGGDLLLGCIALAALESLPFLLNKLHAAGWIFAISICAFGSSALILFLAVKIFEPGENFISTANQKRESGERVLETISPVAFPRWGFAAFGMALVLSTMSFFGAREVWPVLAEHQFFFAIFAVIVGALCRWFAGDWRRTVATIFAVFWLVLMETWASAFHATILRNAALLVYVLALVAALVPILAVSYQHRRFAKITSVANEAGAQAVVFLGRSIIFSTVGGFVFLCSWWWGGVLPFWPAFTVLASSVASLLVYPATAAVLESLFFRRLRADERYRLK